MSEFDLPQPPFKLALTYFGDTLQNIAIRELGDANLWAELVWLNGLVSPYITDNPVLATSTVLLAGNPIKVPTTVGIGTDDVLVFESDCELVNRLLVDNGAGDFSIVSGTSNLKQQLAHAINTPRGQATRHYGYGCLVWHLVGAVNGPTADALGAAYVKATVAADYRITSVLSSVAVSDGDVIRITAVAEAIDGSQLEVIAGS